MYWDHQKWYQYWNGDRIEPTCLLLLNFLIVGTVHLACILSRKRVDWRKMCFFIIMSVWSVIRGLVLWLAWIYLEKSFYQWRTLRDKGNKHNLLNHNKIIYKHVKRTQTVEFKMILLNIHLMLKKMVLVNTQLSYWSRLHRYGHF